MLEGVPHRRLSAGRVTVETGIGAPVVLVAALLLAGCSGDGETPDSEALAGVDVPVFAPVLDGPCGVQHRLAGKGVLRVGPGRTR